jgi:hypothetical protein
MASFMRLRLIESSLCRINDGVKIDAKLRTVISVSLELSETAPTQR